MKILCVIPSYYPAFKFGGPIFSAHQLNKAMAGKGVNVAVYTTNVGLEGKVPANKEIDVDGVKVTYFTYTKLFEFLGATGWQFSFPMRKALKKNIKNFDIVYIIAVWNYPISIAARYCGKYKKPYVISPRGLLYPYATRKKFCKKWLYYCLISRKDMERAHAIHYTTEDEKEKCHQSLGLKNEAVVVPNGIDLSEFNALPSKGSLTSRYPFLKDKKIILFLGRLNWKKGLDILAKAYGKIARERRDVHLVIAGGDEGGYKREIEKWIKVYGVGGKVTFTGMLIGRDKLEAYAGSDIFVLPSYSENFGMTVVEAMACGLPVIISDQVGIHKEVAQARAGIIIDTKPEQLVAALKNLLDNTDICKKTGENGKKLVNERFTVDKAAGGMIEVFQNILHNMKLPISAVVLTYNEEKNIEECLKSVCDWADEIFVVDSYSADKTLEIARRYTDKIVQHPFENFAKQRNWAQDNLPIKNEWVLHLDADERISAELAAELKKIFSRGAGADGFMMPRRTIFRGRWIRRGGHYPVYHLRIFKKNKGKCEERLYDQHYVVAGNIERIEKDIINVITGDLNLWRERHKKWAALEAEEILHCANMAEEEGLDSPIKRRKWLRYNFYYRMPLFIRPCVYFLYRYILRFGFVDGVEGLIFHFWQGFWYRWQVDLEIVSKSQSVKVSERG